MTVTLFPAQALHEFLAVFWLLLSFHDPELWSHLDEMMFKPDLFAIPWFLTSFAPCLGPGLIT